MLRFFRDLRRRLIMPDSIQKYVLYALGEILLVVAGILIALQINNWNENRKSLKQEKTYYCKIAEDFQADIINIDSSIVTINTRLESTDRLLTNLLKVQQDKAVLLNDFISTFRYYRFIPTKAAIIDITSSGKLEKLTNQNLKNRILGHYTQQDNALNIIDINYNAVVESLFNLEKFADLGFQEIPQYQSFYNEELQELLSSTEWHRNPNDEIYIKVKNIMILNVIQLQREKQLLNQIMNDAIALNELLIPYCE